jgi:GAF domain-containing protein
MSGKESIDANALSASLAALRSSLQSNGELSDALQHVTDAAVRLFRVDGAGMMLVDEGQVLRYVAATDRPGRTLETAQAEFGHGPCVDSVVYGQVVTTRDVRTDQRWPRLVERLHPNVRAVLGVPLFLAGGPVGSLNAYRSEPYDWDDSERDALQAFAELLERQVDAALRGHQQGQVIDQLQHALDTRVRIERAVGFLMGRDDIDAVAAFDQLRREARSRRVKVTVVADELLDAARRGSPPA